MWAIQYEKGEYASKHSHHPSDFACVYYVDVEPGCSPIIFEEELEVSPQNGMLLIFPANLRHEVPPTDSRRIVISMNIDEIGSRNMDVVNEDRNVSVKPISVPNSEEEQKVFLEQQLQDFLSNDLSNIMNSYDKNVKEDSSDLDQILEIYNIIESSDVNLTEENIFNFLQIENRWPYQYFKDVENPRQGPSSIYGFETPIQVIVKENIVERNSFYDRTGKFIFDEWKKYYDLGFTTMISDVLDLTPELRKLRSEIFNITGINVEGNFYLTNGGKKVHSSWLPHKHHYNVIVKMIYGDTKWKISDDTLDYSGGDVILIPPETYHSVVECPNKRLSLTINLF
jgi:mannose-6-phosphate isomerase-like protein (cupin superfamily)